MKNPDAAVRIGVNAVPAINSPVLNIFARFVVASVWNKISPSVPDEVARKVSVPLADELPMIIGEVMEVVTPSVVEINAAPVTSKATVGVVVEPILKFPRTKE